MARRLRLIVEDIPYHVIQRGNNRNPIFYSDQDYLFFLKVLKEAKLKHPCLVYSYCLMPNHFHLLVEPKEKENLCLLMKLIGAKYVRYVNKKYERTGTLWEGRFKSCLIDEELYFITCLHYIETNPLRAGIVNLPEHYRWSSYRFRAFGETNDVLDFDPWYNSLADNESERQINYRNFFQDSISDSVLNIIRDMTNKGGIVGRDNFKSQIEKITGKEIIFRLPGRPRKKNKENGVRIIF